MISLLKVLLVALVAIGEVQAAEVQLTADTTDLSVGEGVGLHLTVIDGELSSLPQMPKLSGLEITRRGQRRSSSIVNGRATRSITLSYVIRGRSEGRYTIPPVMIRLVGGERLHTPELVMNVSASEGAATTAIEAGFDGELWEGESVVYRMRFERPGRVLQWGWDPPELVGFAPEQTAEASSREYSIERDGVSVAVLEVATPLVALRSGAREVAGGSVTVEVPVTRSRNRRRSLFMESTRETFTSEPFEASVRPLPEPPEGSEFSRLVGEFQLRATPSQERIELGESVTMRVRMTGNGTLAGFELPAVESELFQVYDQTAERFGEVQGGELSSTALFERAIVPAQVGSLTIPGISILTFSPEAGAYVELTTPPVEIQVLPGEEVDAPIAGGGAGQREVRSEGDDILPIHPGASLKGRVSGSPVAVVAIGGSPILLQALLLVAGRFRRREDDLLTALRKEAAACDPTSPEQVSALLRGALGLCLGVSPSAVTLDSLSALDEEIREEARVHYRMLDELRYGGGGDGVGKLHDFALKLLGGAR